MYKPVIGICLIGAVIALFINACSDGSDAKRITEEPLPPESDCFWTGPLHIGNRNFGRNDEAAVNLRAFYRLPEGGSHISLDTQFPRARYISFTSYGLFPSAQARDVLNDKDILPNHGSINPFVEGSPRNDPYRRFKFYVAPVDTTIPEAENVLYGGSSDPTDIVLLVYRAYLLDRGQDPDTAVDLPRVTLYMEDGSVLQGQEACDAMVLPINPEPILADPDEYAELRENYDPSRNPPIFRARYNSSFQIQCDFYSDCSGDPERDTSDFSNLDSAYLYSFLNREHGEVVVLRGKIPSTPTTFDGEDSVFLNGELRYWSVCQFEYYSTETIDCLFDEEIDINADGFYTIAVSRASDRPDNATKECGVNFLLLSDRGDGFEVAEGRENNDEAGYVTVRNTLPAPDFTHAAQNTETPGDEAEVIGEYLPKGRYFSKGEFEGLGCNPWLALSYDQMQ